jgi:hypothetical protein
MTIANQGEMVSLSIFEKDVSWGYFYATLSRLKEIAKRDGPYVCVMHAWQWDILTKSAAIDAIRTWTPNFRDEKMSGSYVGTVGPVDIYTTTDLTFDANGEMWQRNNDR